MKNFVLIGAAGYVAPRHMEAIKQTGNNLLAALDPHDSVGIIDRYFPNAAFFTEFERFDRHIEKLKRAGTKVDYVTICSPNYLHDAHARFGLRQGANVICEKPLVLNPWNVAGLQSMEKETKKKIFNILQLRHHPKVIELKKAHLEAKSKKKKEITLTYIASRGKWYYASWKGDVSKSGGIATNIGIHFFDMLIWIFGSVQNNEVHIHTHDRASGHLELEHANISWFLSINEDTLPKSEIKKDQKTFRSIEINGSEFDFSVGFEDLHIKSYQEILSGNGFGVSEILPAQQLVYDIRNAEIQAGDQKNQHPYLHQNTLAPHPFNSINR